MIPTKNILPITLVKKNLMKLVKEIEKNKDPIIITKDGRAAGVLISPEEYDGLLETLEILSDKKLVQSLKKSEDDFKKGHTYTHQQVFKE